MQVNPQAGNDFVDAETDIAAPAAPVNLCKTWASSTYMERVNAESGRSFTRCWTTKT